MEGGRLQDALRALQEAELVVVLPRHSRDVADDVVARSCLQQADEGASDTVEGELIECPDCGVELEVTGTNPFTLEEAPQEEEDWGE